MTWQTLRQLLSPTTAPSDRKNQPAGTAQDTAAHTSQAEADINATLATLRNVEIPAGMQARLHQRLAAEMAMQTIPHSAADAAIDATLHALGQVRPPQYLKNRLQARLAREPIAAADRTPVRGWAPWAALGTIAAGLALTVAIHPHTPASPTPPPPASIAAQPTPEIHPGFTPAQRTGRGAALNTNGVVATAQARSEHQADEAINAKAAPGHRKLHQARNNPAKNTRQATLNAPPQP